MRSNIRRALSFMYNYFDKNGICDVLKSNKQGYALEGSSTSNFYYRQSFINTRIFAHYSRSNQSSKYQQRVIKFSEYNHKQSPLEKTIVIHAKFSEKDGGKYAKTISF